ncbi:MAG: response regulator transcription factor [Planctomycetota bacterium]
MTQKTLLLVEDDPDLLEILRLTFEMEGFRLVLAVDGQEALDKARRHAPDLIVLDIMLPKLDGIEVCRQLRAESTFRRVPILMLTAKAEESDVVLGLGIGADDYVVKPARPRELAARVRNLLRRVSQDDSTVTESMIAVGDLVIDPVRFEVRIGDDAPVQLTPSEFKLLQTLAGSPGRVFRRGELLDSTMGAGVIVTERNIDTHVKSVRRKLAERGAWIETVRGVGYRFSDRTEA